MLITADTTVADIATAAPATIRVFQQHRIDFCCGGKVPLSQACAAKGLSTDRLLGELRTATAPASVQRNWSEEPLSTLVQHIQERYHAHLREELPRLDAMLAKVVSRHGDHLPGVLLPLQQTFLGLQLELLAHMLKEDRVLFPLIEALGDDSVPLASDAAAALLAPITVMEAEHAGAGAALARMRQLTGGYAPPEWACPTFRGLYFGLSQLEADMHLHVHLENNILFPRAVWLASRARSSPQTGATAQ
jgi:regulator of cell morphogenesis and NO signaling